MKKKGSVGGTKSKKIKYAIFFSDKKKLLHTVTQGSV